MIICINWLIYLLTIFTINWLAVMWLIQIASFVQSTVQNLKTIKEAGTSIFTWMCHLPKVQDKEDIHSQTGGQ